jgi:hypothetical protein
VLKGIHEKAFIICSTWNERFTLQGRVECNMQFSTNMRNLVSFLPRSAAILFALSSAISLSPNLPRVVAQSSPAEYAGNHLINNWEARNGDRYVFRVDGTYTFYAGPAKRKSGNISHSGTWNLSGYRNSTQESVVGTAQLTLHSTRRTVLEGRRKRVLRAKRTFKIRYLITQADGVSTFDKIPFYTPDSPERNF